MRAQHYQALLAGAAIATAVLFLLAQRVRPHSRSGLAIFNGDLPPIPEYSDNPELQEPTNESEIEPQTMTTSHPPGLAPSEAPPKQWDDAWDDKGLWPNVSKSM